MRLVLRTYAAVLVALMPVLAAASTGLGPPDVYATKDVPGQAVAVNASGMEVFVADASRNRVAIMDQFGHVAYVAVGANPRYIAASNARFFVSNAGDNTVSVRTTGNAVTTIPAGGSGPLVVGYNDVAYMMRPDGWIAIIDAASLGAVRAFDTRLGALAGIALGGVAGTHLYVVSAAGDVQVWDLSQGIPSAPTLGVRLGRAAYGIVNAGGGKMFVLVDGAVVEVDEAIGNPRTFAMPGSPQGPRVIAMGEGTLFAGFANEVAMLDLRSHNVDFIPTGEVKAIHSEFQSGQTFVLDGNARLHVIRPATMMHYTAGVAGGSTDVKFMYKPCTAYVAGPVLTLVHSPCGDIYPGGISAHALWWSPEGAESGWGLNIAHHGYTLFGTWFTYDANGQPTWLVMSDGADAGKNHYQGALYRTTGPAFSAAAFDPSKVTRTPVGTMDIHVSSVNDADMTAVVDGATITKALAKEIFSWPVPVCDAGLAPGALPVYQDLWWNPNESGWGLNIAHQGNILFITWFTYDTDGKATWFVGSDIEKTGNATYSGTLYKTFGPPMTASPWDPSKVTRMPVGNATLTFGDEDHGTFAYTVSGVSGSKAITREIFASPATRCR